jgi:hypothetical protein
MYGLRGQKLGASIFISLQKFQKYGLKIFGLAGCFFTDHAS